MSKTGFKWGKTSKRRLIGVNKDLVECATIVLENYSTYDMTIPWMGGVRTKEEQRDLFDDGFSNCDGVINESNHQDGNGLDCTPCNTNDVILAFYIFACFMFKVWQDKGYKGKLEWGGNWRNSWDKPHWQVTY